MNKYLQSFSVPSLVALGLLGALVLPACSSGSSSSDDEGTGGTSTGGTSSGGGTATGGASGGGTATGGATASVCEGATSAPVAALVSDVEDGVVGWDAYNSTPDDLTAGGSITADAVAVDDGADGSAKSIHFAATGLKTYGGGINFNLEGCKDLTMYEGVRFWVKGTTKATEGQDKPPTITENTINFRVITAGAHGMIDDGSGNNVGGDCVVSSNKCFMPPQKDVPLTEEWVKTEVKFTDLVTPSGANPGSAFNGTNAMLLGWHSSGGEIDVQIDEVEFF